MPDNPGYNYRTYKMFFAQPDLVENYASSYREASFPAFRPGQTNWEAQHPPLYYMLLAAVDKATRICLS